MDGWSRVLGVYIKTVIVPFLFISYACLVFSHPLPHGKEVI